MWLLLLLLQRSGCAFASDMRRPPSASGDHLSRQWTQLTTTYNYTQTESSVRILSTHVLAPSSRLRSWPQPKSQSSSSPSSQQAFDPSPHYTLQLRSSITIAPELRPQTPSCRANIQQSLGSVHTTKHASISRNISLNTQLSFYSLAALVTPPSSPGPAQTINNNRTTEKLVTLLIYVPAM